MNYGELQIALRKVGIECDASEKTRNMYATDESVFSITPELIVFPKNTDEVQRIVRTVASANANGGDFSLTPRAAGTGLAGGSLNDSVIIDVMKYLNVMGKLRKLPDGSARIRTQPGAMFRDFDALTKREGFVLPPYPSSRDICTVGGMVANNAAGPNSLKYGHTVNFVSKLTVVLHNGSQHTVAPVTYTELREHLEQGNALSNIYRDIWGLLEQQYDRIRKGEPHSSKNSSGYAIWDVLEADSIEDFKSGNGYLNLIPLFAGSQGTIGIITDIEFALIPETKVSDLLVVPIQSVHEIGGVIQLLLEHNPYNVEIFDDRTYDLARKNLSFFKKQFYKKSWFRYFRFLLYFYISRIFFFHNSTPAFVLLVTFDGDTKEEADEQVREALKSLAKTTNHGLLVTSEGETEMFWKIRFASYSLAKLGKENRRPAAFLEDMVIPSENLSPFLEELSALLAEYKADYAMHGHGGNGHFHFYPLLDFTDPETPQKIKHMADDFFALAEKYDGNICGEHNDGIIRTPYMHQLFSAPMLELFAEIEKIFDPLDIFNPGKKVNPKFDIVASIRKVN